MATTYSVEDTRAFVTDLSSNPEARPLPAQTMNLLFDLAHDQAALNDHIKQAGTTNRPQDGAQLTARLKRSVLMTECLRTYALDEARDAVEEGDTRFDIIMAQRFLTVPEATWMNTADSADGVVPTLAELKEEDTHVLQWYGRDTDDDDKGAAAPQSDAGREWGGEGAPKAEEN